MIFFEMEARTRVIVFLVACVVIGPPLGFVLFEAAAAMWAPGLAYPMPAEAAALPGVLIFSYWQGIFPAATAAWLLYVFYSKSAVLKLWWVLATAFASTCIWYYLDIIINPGTFRLGLIASVVVLVIWSAFKLVWRERAEAK